MQRYNSRVALVRQLLPGSGRKRSISDSHRYSLPPRRGRGYSTRSKDRQTCCQSVLATGALMLHEGCGDPELRSGLPGSIAASFASQITKLVPPTIIGTE